MRVGFLVAIVVAVGIACDCAGDGRCDATSDAGVPEAEVAAYRDEPLSFSVGEGETVTSTSVLGRASQKVLAPLARLRSLTPACPVQVRSRSGLGPRHGPGCRSLVIG